MFNLKLQKMKKLFIAALLLTEMFTYCYGQNVNVNINNQDLTKDDCGFMINGICSSEDIGGVDIQGVLKYAYDEGWDGYWLGLYAVLTNYNPFTVTVLFKKGPSVYTVILRPDETKEVMDKQSIDNTIYDSPKSSINKSYSVDGMIVRKLGQ